MQNHNARAKQWSRHVIPALLVLLFTYAAFSKMLDFGSFQAQMLVQPLPRSMAFVLAYILPPMELAASGLLLFQGTRRSGLGLSFVLMLAFTGYAGLAYFHFWASAPCPCGGILGSWSWGLHLVFNLLFLMITIVSIAMTREERRAGDPKDR